MILILVIKSDDNIISTAKKYNIMQDYSWHMDSYWGHGLTRFFTENSHSEETNQITVFVISMIWFVLEYGIYSYDLQTSGWQKQRSDYVDKSTPSSFTIITSLYLIYIANVAMRPTIQFAEGLAARL